MASAFVHHSRSSRSLHSVGIFLLAIQTEKSFCPPCCILMKPVSQCARTCSPAVRRSHSSSTRSAQASSVLSVARGETYGDSAALPKHTWSALCQPEEYRYELCAVAFFVAACNVSCNLRSCQSLARVRATTALPLWAGKVWRMRSCCSSINCRSCSCLESELIFDPLCV